MSEIRHDYAEIELLYNRFTRPSARKALKQLKKQFSEDIRIIDAGCGPGSHFELFEEVFPGAKVTAVDISQPHLERAREKADKVDLTVEVVKEDLEGEIGFEEKSFDLIWFGDVICPSDIEGPAKLINGLKPYLKNEGVMAVFYGNWLRQEFMPGYARLEQKINSAYELMHETKNLKKEWQGPDHPEKALKWLQEANFDKISQSIHSSHYSKPDIPEHAVKYVEHVFENDYSDAVQQKGEEAGLTEQEMSKWRQLSDKEGLMYLLDKNDYYCCMNCLLTYGVK